MAISEQSPFSHSEAVQYEPIISPEHSMGARARQLWQSRFEEVEDPQDAHIVWTGIGGAPGSNRDIPVRQFGDGSRIPSHINLKNAFGTVPRVLFLPVSALTADDVIGLRGVARNYKEHGVSKIFPIFTSLAHERQDHRFTDSQGRPIQSVTTLKDVIEILADHRYIDGGIIIQPHSLRCVEIGLRSGFPLLPIDAFDFMFQAADLRAVPNPFVLGPDKGRKDEARKAAALLQCPMGSATKTRDRRGDGNPTLIIQPEALDYMREHDCNVIVFDDEIREAGTTGGLAIAIENHARSMIIVAVKPIFARGPVKTAVEQLNHPLISRIVVTDAVKPLTDVSPIANKLEVVALEPEIKKIVSYLARKLTSPRDPNWLNDPQETGTLLHLDLSVEQY